MFYHVCSQIPPTFLFQLEDKGNSQLCNLEDIVDEMSRGNSEHVETVEERECAVSHPQPKLTIKTLSTFDTQADASTLHYDVASKGGVPELKWL